MSRAEKSPPATLNSSCSARCGRVRSRIWASRASIITGRFARVSRSRAGDRQVTRTNCRHRREIVSRGSTLLVTRASEQAFEEVRTVVPGATFDAEARIISLRQGDVAEGKGTILIVAAGTSDVPVAEEAVRTAELMGNTVERLYDVGVAGLHRLLGERSRLDSARVIIVIAGMEGALPSVVAGLVSVPVIAVPTSIGYGASFGGIAALLGMLNSCASGVSVVNIDNGFGAANIASLINHL